MCLIVYAVDVLCLVFINTMLPDGKVLLNGKEHNNWELTKFIFNEKSVLVVYIG